MRPLCLSPNSGFQWEAVGELRMVGVLGWDAPCIVSKQLLIHEPASPYKTCHHEYLLQSKRHFATTLLSFWVLGDDRVVLVPSAFANLLASIARPSFADVLTDECSWRRDEGWMMRHKFCPVSGGFGQIVVTHLALSHAKIIFVGISPSFRISRLVKYHMQPQKALAVCFLCWRGFLGALSPHCWREEELGGPEAGDALEKKRLKFWSAVAWELYSNSNFQLDMCVVINCWPPKGMTRLNTTRFVLPLQYKLLKISFGI